MKITRERLEEIIKEEIDNTVDEVGALGSAAKAGAGALGKAGQRLAKGAVSGVRTALGMSGLDPVIKKLNDVLKGQNPNQQASTVASILGKLDLDPETLPVVLRKLGAAATADRSAGSSVKPASE